MLMCRLVCHLAVPMPATRRGAPLAIANCGDGMCFAWLGDCSEDPDR